MAGSSATKVVKTKLRSAIRDGFADRGWTTRKGQATTFVAPSSVMGEPLELSWSSEVDSDKFGGARFTGSAAIRSQAVTDLVLSLDPGSRPETFENFPGDELARLMLTIDWVSAGELVDPVGRNYHAWTVGEESELEPAVSNLFALVDTRLLEWAEERSTPAAVLQRHLASAEDDPVRKNSTLVRTLSTLALLEGDPDSARQVVRSYVDPSGYDTERVALFERELSARFPEYGSLQLSSS